MKQRERDLGYEHDCEVSRRGLHRFSFIYMLVLEFGRKARPTESKESLPRRSWSQGTTNAIKIMLVEKALSIVLVGGVSFSYDIEPAVEPGIESTIAFLKLVSL